MIKKLSLLKFLVLSLGVTLASATFSPLMAQDDAADAVEDAAAEITEYVEIDISGAAAPDDDYIALATQYGQTFDFFTISNLWILIAAGLVFLMHLGFATLESGMTQSKNTVNILFKNVFIICMGIITYLLTGFNSMYPVDAWIIKGFYALNGPVTMADYGGTDFGYGGTGLAMTGWTDFIFQAMFAATAATIVSGAVAERIKLPSFMLLATILVAFGYPVTGSWQWGGGWLSENGFYDFAGSSLVHAFGGFAALAAVIVLGPRKGKYTDNGIKPILGHSMPLATIGVFLLFLGWFGFNGGSVLSAAPEGVSFVFVTTAVAAAAGGLSSILVSWVVIKKPDLTMALNGILAGLVGITAGADSVTLFGSVLIGLIAGFIVVFAILIFDKIKIDDPVGAISVHGVCGIWGTLAVAIFQQEGAEINFMWQLIGTLSISAFAFIFCLIFAIIVKVIMGLRVSEDEEVEGLDIGEHGQEAYPDFAPSIKG